ncbi:hypothetical protein lbkm_2589 [Lachnospiraceae bacterium KM106-2]|nr:hypothetical protein lbkm_2589 [Lachnospiraceae bacterium KM106-2]
MSLNNMNISPHTVDLMKAALPYSNYNAQNSMNVLIKATELADSLQDMTTPPDLSSCDIKNQNTNPEELLMNIKPVCTPQESEFVDMLLNFMQARKIYHAYQEYNTTNQVHASDMKNQNNSQNNNQQTNTGFPRGPLDFLMSQLSPEQRNMFENMRMMINSMNQGGINPFNFGSDSSTSQSNQ